MNHTQRSLGGTFSLEVPYANTPGPAFYNINTILVFNCLPYPNNSLCFINIYNY